MQEFSLCKIKFECNACKTWVSNHVIILARACLERSLWSVSVSNSVSLTNFLLLAAGWFAHFLDLLFLPLATRAHDHVLLRVHASNRARARGWTRAQRAETVVHVVFEEEPNRRNASWSCDCERDGGIKGLFVYHSSWQLSLSDCRVTLQHNVASSLNKKSHYWISLKCVRPSVNPFFRPVVRWHFSKTAENHWNIVVL